MYAGSTILSDEKFCDMTYTTYFQTVMWHTVAKVKINNFLHQQFFSIKLRIYSYPSILTCVLGALKNRLIKMVLVSSHNICLYKK